MREGKMYASLTIKVEHLAGPCEVTVHSELEPNNELWNQHTYMTMCKALNQIVAAMFAERDRLRFDEEVLALRGGESASERGHD